MEREHDALIDADALAFGIPLDAAQRDKLMAFTRLLEKWNKSIRLTGPTAIEPLLREQVLEALAFVPFAREADAWWDVGSGGGLPALIVAMLEPTRRFWLIEPIAKKVAFMKQAVLQLDLKNVVIFHGRLEDDGSPPPAPPSARNQAPPRAAMSRATFPPEVWFPLASRLVGPGGLVLIASVERPVAVTERATIVKETAYVLPATGVQRHLTLLDAASAE